MNVITYDVYKNTVKKHDGFNPVTSEKNYSKLQFRFRDDDAWINCSIITASFWISNDNIVKSDAELLSDNLTATFDIPPEFSGVKGTIKVGLQGSYKKDNEDVTVATNIIALNRNDGVIVTEGTNAVLYEEIIALVNKFFNDDKEKIDAFISEVNHALSSKADKATTLDGYGITDGLKFKYVGNIDDCTDDKTLYHVYITEGVENSYYNLICINWRYKKAQYIFADCGKIYFRVSSRKNDLDAWSDWSEWSAVVNDTDLSNALETKADKSTTLAGYGITDAYTKTEVDTALSGKVDNTVGLKFALKNNIDDCTDDKTLYRVYINDGSVSKGYHNLICINQTYKKAQYLFAQDGKIQFRVSSRYNEDDAWSDWSEWSAVVNDTDLSKALATEVDELLTKLGTKNFSFLRDSFGRIIDYTRDTRITSTSFKLYNNNDLSKGYSAWFGKTVTNVENGALSNIDKLQQIVCENKEAVLESNYDNVTVIKGENPYSEYYKLVSLARLYNEKADKATTYTKSEVDTKLSGKLNNTAGSVITDNIASKAVTKDKLNDDVKDMLYMTSTQNWVNALVGTAKTGGFFFDSTGKKIVTNKYSGALISVKGGDKIKVSARTSSASPYLVTFYSDYTYVEGTAQGESYTFLEGYGIASTDYNDEEITVPVGAKYAGVNSYITGDTAIPLSVYKLADIVYDTPVKSAVKDMLNNSTGAVGTDNIANGAITELKLADDVRTKLQEVVNTLPKCMVLPDSDNTRALYVDGRYLYNCHATNRAVTKCDIGIETDPQNIETVGGHAKTYPRGMAVGNGYLYVPYRDEQGGTKTSFGNEDVGGYLDTINLSNFSVASTIAYPREPYDPGDGKKVRYYGKSHNAATYNDKYLCVTQQLGGWLLYDISENPVIDDKVKPLYKCDNRAQSTIDHTEFQQPAFYTDGTMVFLAITGYDRHLLKIYNLNDPTYPICVYSGDLRELWQHGNTAYLHTMGLACQYPYIYCTVAPFPDSETVKYSTDFENTMQGVAVVDVTDINRVKVNFYKIPDESRTINSGGEPSPQSIAVTKNHLIMDMFDKGISVWSLANPAEPKFLGNLDTGATKVCSVMSTEDGRTFIGTEYQGGNLTMYRGI